MYPDGLRSGKSVYCRRHNLWYWEGEECKVCKAVREGRLKDFPGSNR
jgi:hypothetical protein